MWSCYMLLIRFPVVTTFKPGPQSIRFEVKSNSNSDICDLVINLMM